jgi:hypothetical protein
MHLKRRNFVSRSNTEIFSRDGVKIFSLRTPQLCVRLFSQRRKDA